MAIHDAGIISKHENRFEKIELRVNALERDMSLQEAAMDMVKNDLYNHGKDGLLTRFNTFFAKHEEREDLLAEQQEQRHKENSAKLEALNTKIGSRSLAWTVAGVFVAIAALAIAVFMVVITMKLPQGQLDPAKILHSINDAPTLSQNAGALGPHHF